ncbi:conserved hypothetical protein [Agrobacterium genomosp. 5 str. CFBP 6626]|nr:conserved hypothetical protein [Agrobacterium genomosp. 5 str. CFBP 6626]
MRHVDRKLYVPLLGRLVPADQKEINFFANAGEIDPIPRTVVDAHFGNAATYRLAIAEISMLGSGKTVKNPHLSSAIL